VDGTWLKRFWGGEVQTVSVLVAVGVNKSGYREVLGVAEGSREDGESWRQFLCYLRSRGLEDISLVISDRGGVKPRQPSRVSNASMMFFTSN
jgi:transposase-like protein